MGRIEKFEDLDVWKEARVLRNMVSEITRKSIVKNDFMFCNQIRSSALSIMSNIAEGFESQSKKEFINFLSYARRSCGELRCQLYAAFDDKYIDVKEFNKIYQQTVKVGKMLTNLISYLRKTT